MRAVVVLCHHVTMGPESALPPGEEIARMLGGRHPDGGVWTQARIAQRYGVKQQAVSVRLRRYRDRAGNGAVEREDTRLLPWRVKAGHSQDRLYRSILYYAKWKAGRGVNPEELSAAQRVERTMWNQDAVIYYDGGFGLRRRRPDDDPHSVLAQR